MLLFDINNEENKSKERRVFGVFLDEKFESTLAFHKALELIKKNDFLILISIIDATLVESQLVHYKNQPPYQSLIEAKAEEIAEKIQHNFHKICKDRNVNFNYMYEYGNPKLQLVDVIEQEKINTIILANLHDKKGLFSKFLFLLLILIIIFLSFVY